MNDVSSNNHHGSPIRAEVETRSDAGWLEPASWRLGTAAQLWKRAYDCRQPQLVDAPRLWGTLQDADSVLVRVGDERDIWCFKAAWRPERLRPGERPRKVCAVIAGNYQQLMLLGSMVAPGAYQPVYQLALVELLRRDRRAGGAIEWLVREHLLTTANAATNGKVHS